MRFATTFTNRNELGRKHAEENLAANDANFANGWLMTVAVGRMHPPNSRHSRNSRLNLLPLVRDNTFSFAEFVARIATPNQPGRDEARALQWKT
jgi:hypothetical protein